MGKLEKEKEGELPEGEAGDGTDEPFPRNARLRRHMKSLAFHRAIHRKLDDGALIALCENYGDEEREHSGEGSRKGGG